MKKLGRHIMSFKNSIRRTLVNSIIGHELIIQKVETPAGIEVIVIDENRRLNYSRWKVKKINRRDIMLTR